MRYACIVVGTDGSKSATESVRQAAVLAAQSNAVIHIVGAYRDLTWGEAKRARRAVPAGLDIDGVADPRAEIPDILDDKAYAIRDYQPRLWLHAVKSDPCTALNEVAARKGGDLIVVGNRGIADPLRWFRRPICEQVRKRASCELLVVDTARFWPGGSRAVAVAGAALR
jgi:nucleotide-binding universal stress UspA family protein